MLPTPSSSCRHHTETWTDVRGQAEWVVHGDVPVCYEHHELRNQYQAIYELHRDLADICYALRWPTPEDIEALFETDGDYS